jgi:putative heme iron utilization protein
MDADFSAILVHASNLARHTAGLENDAPFSFLVHSPESQGIDPQQLARVSLNGTVTRLEKNTDAYADGATRYQEKYPGSQITFGMGDFNLYRLEVQSGRFVAGFGKIYNLFPPTLKTIQA